MGSEMCIRDRRWGLVSNILHALTAMGRWRLDGALGPMHKWYDPRSFDVLSHEEIMTQRAVDREGAALTEARTGEELLGAVLDVRFFGAECDEEEGSASVEGDADVEVDESVFCRWLERSEFVLGTQVARWWVQLDAETAPFGGGPWELYHEEIAADFFAKLRTKCSRDGVLTARRLMFWLRFAGALRQPEAATADDGREDLVDRVLEAVSYTHLTLPTTPYV